MPIIELTGTKDTLLGKSKAIEVQGTKLDTGEEWSKKFFKNNRELVEALESFEIGDEVNVVMVQDPNNSKFWNIEDFRVVTEEDREKLESKKRFGTKGGGRAAGTDNAPRRMDGGSRGDDTNRSAAIYLAQEVVAMQQPDWEPEELAKYMVKIANEIIYPYIKEGKVAELSVKTESAEAPARPRRTKAPELPTT